MTKTLPMMRSNFRTGPARWTLALTQFLLILDAAVLNVAVPHIGASFAMAPATQSWLINAFVVPFAGLLLVSGVIADRFGRRRTLVVGLSLLLVGAVAGALAASSTMVLASRVVQGAGGALAGAAAMSLVLHLFSGADRARVLALFATMGGAGGVAGTIIGGTVTEASGWRTLFWLAAVAAALGAVSALRWIPVDTEMTRRRVVWSGPLLMTTALACAAFSLTSAGTYTLVSRTVWVPAAISIVATLGFVLSEARSSSPVIPKTVWRNSRLISALFLAACAQFALTPTFLLVSVYPQEHMAYTATAAGLVLLPMSIVIVLFAPTLPRLLARSNLHVLLLVAFAAISIGGGLLALLISPSRGYLTAFLIPTLIIGIGVPTSAMATSIAAARSAGTTPPGLTAGLLTTSQQFGAAIGLASLPTVAARQEGGYEAAFAVIAVVGALVAAAIVAAGALRRTSSRQSSV